MSEQNTVLVGWKKSWTSAASTYLVEVTEDEVWLGRLGSGGAFWEPTYNANIHGLGSSSHVERTVIRRGGAVVGKAIGNKILGKFQKEIKENADKYQSGGREALAHKANQTWPKSVFANAELKDKMPGGAPAALKSMPGPYVEASIEGKTWYFVSLPDGPSTAEEFLEAVQ